MEQSANVALPWYGEPRTPARFIAGLAVLSGAWLLCAGLLWGFASVEELSGRWAYVALAALVLFAVASIWVVWRMNSESAVHQVSMIGLLGVTWPQHRLKWHLAAIAIGTVCAAAFSLTTIRFAYGFPLSIVVAWCLAQMALGVMPRTAREN